MEESLSITEKTSQSNNDYYDMYDMVSQDLYNFLKKQSKSKE